MPDGSIAKPIADLPSGLAFAESALRAGGEINAIIRLAALQGRFPDSPAPLLRAMEILRRTGRHALLIAVTQEGRTRFPAETRFLIAIAEAQQESGLLQDALHSWALVRDALPAAPVGWTSPARALRDSGQFDEADALLRDGVARMPQDQALLSDLAWVAHIRRDWPEAERRWAAFRSAYPESAAGYVHGAMAVRELGRLEEARSLLDQAIARFPDDPTSAIDRAWLGHVARDWSDAIAQWQRVRDRFPGQLAGYTGGARSLTDAGETAAAETLLGLAAERFPNEPGPVFEHAALAMRRRDWLAAEARWATALERFPHLSQSDIGAAQVLREQHRFTEADARLADAASRFPGEADIAAEQCWVAHIARDWPEADRRWQSFRERFPDQLAGWVHGAMPLREQQRYDEAETLLQDAQRRFPHEAGPVFEHAWLAWAKRDWPEAARRWHAVRQRFPQKPEAWLRAAMAEAEQWRYAEAEALLTEAIGRFPHDAALALEHAAVILRQQRLEDALQAYESVLQRFPDLLAAQTAHALILRNQFRLAEAEARLTEIMARFPNEPAPALEHAMLPVFAPLRSDKNPAAALQRLEALCRRFPDFEPGYTARIKTLCGEDRHTEADGVAQEAVQRLPASASLIVERGNIALAQHRVDEAIARFQHARDHFASEPGGWIGLGRALVLANRLNEAEAVLREATARFPTVAACFIAYAEAAIQRQDIQAALDRLAEGQKRFPDDRAFAQRIFDLRLQHVETVSVEPDAPATDDPRAGIRDLVLQFESLGGRGLGCEFGMFQREFGAEPLDLLRWADMPYDGIVRVLETRFDGVGDAEHTEVFVNRESPRPEYCSHDRRGFMFMRAFVYEDEMPMDRMRRQILRRIAYLKQKLIEDLESGSKTFVWRLTERNLTDEKINRLHAAVRSYGNNVLFYVRLADALHPNGSVEIRAPGLMVGYIDQFKMSPEGKLRATPPTASWLALCRRAQDLLPLVRQS